MEFKKIDQITSQEHLNWNFQPNLNKRLDPLVHSVKSIRQKEIQRIANLAIPFLNLYHPASVVLSIVFGSLQAWTLGKQIVDDGKKGDWQSVGKQAFQVSLITSVVALSILMPVAGVIVSGALQISRSAFLLIQHLRAGAYLEAGRQLVLIAHQVIYIASSVYGAPDLLLASLLAQAIVEISRACKEWKKGKHLPEVLAHLLMAALRLHSASSQAKVVYRNNFGHKIKQEDVKIILTDIQKYRNAHPEKLIDFEKILIDRFYSNKIHNISFKQDGADLTQILFRNLVFSHCDFSGLDLSRSIFQHITAYHCNFKQVFAINACFENFQAMHCLFKNTIFIRSLWNHCYFDACELTDATHRNSTFNQTHFENSNLDRVNFFKSEFNQTAFRESSIQDANFTETTIHETRFQGSQLNQSVFNSAKLEETVFENCLLKETSFFDAQVNNCQIKDSDLTDCLLLDNKDRFQIIGGVPHHLTKPVIGLLWNFEEPTAFAKIINNALKDSGAVVLRFSYLLRESNKEQLEAEIKEKIEAIQEKGLSEDCLSIGDALLKGQAGQELQKIKSKTEKIAGYIQGLLLPGGEDIEPEFYGQTLQGMSSEIEDYQRTVFELGMISQAVNKNIQLQGICRGSQIVNIFLGGDLKQHVEGHQGVIHSLKIKESSSSEARDLTKHILQGDQINGLSMHHQACDKIGKGLEVTLEHEGVPKALVSQDGKIILTQFHPEAYLINLSELDKHKLVKLNEKDHTLARGKNFFTYLIQQAKTQKVC